MTKSSKLHSPEFFRDWAAEKLEVDASSDQDGWRRAFLLTLADEQLVPYDYQQEAFEIAQQLCGEDPPAEIAEPESYTLEQRESALEELNGFCREFMDLEPDERNEQYELIRENYGSHLCVRKRLQRLQPLLNFDLDQLQSESLPVQELVSWLIESAGLTPYQTGLLRQQLRRKACRFSRDWARAATRVKRQYPQVAAVDPAFLKQLQRGDPDPTIQLPKPHRAGAGYAKLIGRFISDSPLILVVLIFSGLGLTTWMNSNDRARQNSFQVPTKDRNRFRQSNSDYLRQLYSKQIKDASKNKNKKNMQRPLPPRPRAGGQDPDFRRPSTPGSNGLPQSKTGSENR